MKNFIKSLTLLLILGIISCDPKDTIEPIAPSDGAIIEPELGGADEPNQVYIDLSSDATTVVARTAWDLGFSNGEDFKVILNYSTYDVARPTDQSDLAMVSSNLVTPEYKAVTVVAPEGNIEWIDNPNGDLNETAIASISSTDSENLVYVINRGQTENGQELTERGFLKVKITRSGNDYVVTWGEIDDTSFNTFTVTKDSKYNFTFFSFDDGLVKVEPEKNLWDFAMTTTSNHFFDYATNTTVPYRFKDFVISNYNNVKLTAVEVTDAVNYADFNLGDLPSLELKNNRTAIGSSWRLFDFPTFSYLINSEIFYVIEDTEGNNYKLMFTRMYCIEAECTGERGYPEFTYELLK